MIGKRMQRLRLARGLTQAELAAPNYTHSYVSTIEAGRRRPSRRALEYFADKLGVSAEELETGVPPDLEARLELRVHEARIALSAGRLDEVRETITKVGRDAKRFRLTRIESTAEEIMGLSLERGGKPEEALEHYRHAEELLGSEPPTVRVDAVAGQARVFQALGDVRYAVHVLESVLDSIERADLRDPHALCRVHASLVDAYLDAGLYGKAAESATELERLAPRITDPLRIAQMHLHVAHAYLVQGKSEDALLSLRRSEDAYRQLELKTETAYAHLARGYVLSREGRLEDAREQLEEALAVFEDTGDEKDLARTLNELARIHRVAGRPDRAAELLERSIALLGDGDTPVLAWANREMGLTQSDVDPTAAEKSFRVAIELYERSEQSVDIAVTYRALGDLLMARGEHEAGCEAYRTGILALESHL